MNIWVLTWHNSEWKMRLSMLCTKTESIDTPNMENMVVECKEWYVCKQQRCMHKTDSYTCTKY